MSERQSITAKLSRNSASRRTNVPTGGRKRKLNAATLSSAVMIEAPPPKRIATMMIPSRYTMTMFAARRYGESIQAIPFSATVRTDASPSRREEEDMSYRALTPALVVFLMTSPAVAANMAKYSGSIVAVNPAKHTVNVRGSGAVDLTAQHAREAVGRDRPVDEIRTGHEGQGDRR